MNILSALKKRKNLFQVIRIISDCHMIEYGRIYLVGGAVRDLIMERNNICDLDILITYGKPSEFAKCLKKAISVENICEDKKYNTVKLLAKYKEKSFTIDINRTRTENYASPGSLPEIKWVDSLFYDMQRRDFSINAIALSINNDSFGELLAYSGGINDLNYKRIRILYDKSFIDDPTRLIRLIRYKERLGFNIEKKTEYFFNKALSENYLKHISDDRILNELIKCLREDYSYLSFKSFNDFNFFNGFIFNTSDLKRFEKFLNTSVAEICIPSDIILLKILILKNPLFLTYNLPCNYKKHLKDHIKNFNAWKKSILLSKSDSELYRIAKSVPDESLYAIAFTSAPGDDLWILINHYFESLKGIKTHLTGKDLISMGIKPGKRIGLLLNEILECRIDGVISNKRKAEIEFIEKKLGRNV